MAGDVTPQMKVDLLLVDYPAVIPLLNKKLMACVGCGMARFETLEDLARNYGLNLDHFIQEIGEIISNSHSA